MTMQEVKTDNVTHVQALSKAVFKNEDGLTWSIIQLDTLVSGQLVSVLSLVNYVIISSVVSVFGIIFNVVNIVVFVRLGFTDTVNISLLALAVADLLSLLPLVSMGVGYNPILLNRYRNMDFEAIFSITGVWTHISFSRIVAWLIAFITLERYMCVALPLRVRTIITPTRTRATVVGIFTIFTTAWALEYFAVGIGPYVNSHTNATVIGLTYTQSGHQIENALIHFAMFAQFASFLSVSVCTAGLVATFRRKIRWRDTSVVSAQKTNLSTRDNRAVKMIICISTIFIACYLPVTVSQLGMLFYHDYNIGGRYHNLLVATTTFFFCLEAVNSSSTIFVYYNMSSRYREMLVKIMQNRQIHLNSLTRLIYIRLRKRMVKCFRMIGAACGVLFGWHAG